MMIIELLDSGHLEQCTGSTKLAVFVVRHRAVQKKGGLCAP